MAKRKKEKIVDLKPKQVTKEQLDRIQNSINNLNRSQLEIGSIELKKHELLHNIAGLTDELTSMQVELEKEYGTFDINIADGTINYPKEDVKTD